MSVRPGVHLISDEGPGLRSDSAMVYLQVGSFHHVKSQSKAQPARHTFEYIQDAIGTTAAASPERRT